MPKNIMENNFDYEIDVEDAIMRTKGRKNRQSKEFKKFAKSGIVRKYVVPDENGAIVNPSALPDEDPFGLQYSVYYSLNKKGRWANIPSLRAVDELEDEMGTKVSTMENVFLPSLRRLSHKALTKAYYQVNGWGNVVGRHSKRFLAQERTLTEKQQPPRKLATETDDEISNPIPHIRYETNMPHPSEKYWQHANKKRNDFRPSDKVVNARARRILERDISLNCSDEDDFSNSDTESDAADDDFEQVDGLTERQQYSLFDYVANAERKPKKSEGFVFLNIPSYEEMQLC